MNSIDEIKSKRFQFLHELWKMAGGDHGKRVLIRQISEPLNMTEDESRVIVQYLSGEGLLEVTTHGFNVPRYSDASLYIKHAGVVEVEDALSKPEQPTKHFPVNVVNNIQIGTMTNSNIVQAGENATQTVMMSQESKKEISEIVMLLKKFVANQEIQQEKRDELKSEISTIESQINSSKPKSGIISESLSSAKSILESASNIAVTVAPVVAQISTILGMIR